MATSSTNIESSNEVSIARIRRRQSAKRAYKDTDSLRPSSDPEVLESTADRHIHAPEVLESTTDRLINAMADHQHIDTIQDTLLEGGDATPDREVIPIAKGIAVVIHHTDDLRASVHLRQPVVRVSMIDAKSGQHVKKTRPDLCAVSYYERQNETVDYILPIQTQPFCPGKSGSVLRPVWEESLVINEDSSKLYEENTVFFFEILALPTACSNWADSRQAQSWYKIAWSFLRPTRSSLVGRKCRLQLYSYPNQQAEVYPVWTNHKMTAYSSTLYITVKVITLEDQPQPTMRSMAPHQKEEGSVPFEQLTNQSHAIGITSSTSVAAGPLQHTSAWTRAAGQSCQVPNRLDKVLHPGTQGCSALAFSPDGRFLACAGVSGESYPVTIWEVSSWTLVLSSDDHRGLVYNFSWSSQSSLVASASADSVCRVWSLERSAPPLTLPHPCFVYGVQFAASAAIVCTAAYDACLRVWRLREESVDLVAELREHRGLVNCLASDGGRSTLYSCDSVGGMCIWTIRENAQLQRKVKVTEGESILQITLHSAGKKALIRTVNQLVMFDLRIEKVVHCYTSSSVHTCSLISPCGTLVFSGTKDGCLYAWRTDVSEAQRMRVTCLQKMDSISSMAFHPVEHVIAVSAVASHQPVAVLVYENSMNNT